MQIGRIIPVAIVATSALCPLAHSKPTQPKTVLDYFLLLPNRSYFAVPFSTAQRKTWLRDQAASVKPIVDIPNDYILFPPDGAQGMLQFAVFRHKGRALIVVRNDYEDGRLDFLRYENNKWKDVTKQMMPVPYDVRYDYHVPRWGTTIKVTAGRKHDKDQKTSPDRGQRIYDFVWVDGQFKVKR